MTDGSDPAEAVMDDVAGRPADAPTGYENDFYLWCFVQAEHLRQQRFSQLDLPNLIEELESMGRSDRRALESSYRLVLAHLLKWQYQPQLRSSSWEVTLLRERAHIAAMEKDSPSLKSHARRMVEVAYIGARKEASIETGLPIPAFPPGVPYTLAQLRDPDWLPGLPSEPEPLSGAERKPAGSRRAGTRQTRK